MSDDFKISLLTRRLYVLLVFDHRLIDGAYAARFLQRFMRLVSEPSILLAVLR